MIEVNELQKRRVIGKLQQAPRRRSSGKRVALLGLAFKPNTDDMREASSLVLAARLQADGAHVSAYDPVAEEQARELMQRHRASPTRALEARARTPTRSCSSPSGSEFVELDWRRGRRGDARRRW